MKTYDEEEMTAARADAYRQGRVDGLQRSADIRERQAEKDARFDRLNAQLRRDRAANAALQGLLACPYDAGTEVLPGDIDYSCAALHAVAYADALLAALKESK